MLVYKRGAAAGPRRRVGGGEVCQGDDLDGILASTMSFAGVVELGPGPCLAFVTVVLWQGSPESVAPLGPDSPAPALLEAKRGQGGVGLLELRQGRRHPAVVGVAEDEALLRAVLRGFGQSFLQVHFDSWERGKTQGTVRDVRTKAQRESSQQSNPRLTMTATAGEEKASSTKQCLSYNDGNILGGKVLLHKAIPILQ